MREEVGPEVEVRGCFGGEGVGAEEGDDSIYFGENWEELRSYIFGCNFSLDDLKGMWRSVMEMLRDSMDEDEQTLTLGFFVNSSGSREGVRA